jgi:hypothetical protein
LQAHSTRGGEIANAAFYLGRGHVAAKSTRFRVRAMRRRSKNEMLEVLAGLAVIGLVFWLWLQPPAKPVPAIPAFGGSPMAVQLADSARYFQRDPRWTGQRLGGSADTVGSAGCAVTSAAMAMTNLGYTIDPGQLSGALTAKGGFTEEGWVVWDAVRRVSKGTLRVEVHEAPSLERLDACLASGDYPLVKFMLKSGFPHWVVLVGKRDGAYLMRDPLLNEATPIPLTRRTQVILSVRCIGRGRQAEARR